MRIPNTLAPKRQYDKRAAKPCALGKYGVRILVGLLFALCFFKPATTLAEDRNFAWKMGRLPMIQAPVNEPFRAAPLPGEVPEKVPKGLPQVAPSTPPVNFPSAAIGPGKPVGDRIKILRIPDLYGQCPNVQTGALLNLCEAISYAAVNNPRICQAQADVNNARAGKKVAFAPFLPSISAQDVLYKSSNPFTSIIYGGLSTSPDQELNITEVQAEWIIWDFGRTLGNYRQSDILLKIAQFRCARACQTVGFDTADAYFEVLIGKASVRVANDAIKRAEEYLRVAKNLYDAGKIDSEGVLSAQLELVNAQQRMVDAIARRQVAVAALNNMLGMRLLDNACVQDVTNQPDFFPPIENCIQIGLSKRPEMCVAINEINYALQQCKIAKAQFRPEAIANGAFTNVDGDFQATFWEGNVQFQWDLFTGGARSGTIREAQAVMARARANQHQIRDNIIYEINQSYEKLRAARHQLNLSRAAITVAREKQRIVLNKFRVGKASPTDVVDAQTQLTSAEQDYYTAIYRLHIAIADLNYQMGNIACCPMGEM